MAQKKIEVTMPNAFPKTRVIKFEVDDPKESTEPVKNVYVDKGALKKLGNPDEIVVTITAKED